MSFSPPTDAECRAEAEASDRYDQRAEAANERAERRGCTNPECYGRGCPECDEDGEDQS